MSKLPLDKEILGLLKKRFPKITNVTIRYMDGGIMEVKSIAGKVEHAETVASRIGAEQIANMHGGWWYDREQRLKEMT